MELINQKISAWLENNAPVAIIIFDEDARVIQANSFARRLLGENPAGKTLSQVFVDFHGDLNLKYLAADPDREQMLHLGSGKSLPQSLYFSFVQTDSRYFALGRPEADKIQKLERALQDISAQLSNANRELQQKNAQLARLNEQKNRFLGMAAHDLRSPLGHVLTCSGFLLDANDGQLNDEDKEFLEIIRDSTSFMLAMIDDILDISAIEAGRLNLNLATTNLPALVQENVKLNSLLAAKHDLQLAYNNKRQIPDLEIDSDKINQVMNNLLSNAMKFSPPGSLISVLLSSSPAEVVVSVADQGPGISAEDIPRLFQPFNKTSIRPLHDEKSTGLGLSIAQRIIQGHGGRIWVESQEGQGATFHFSLPLKD